MVTPGGPGGVSVPCPEESDARVSRVKVEQRNAFMVSTLMVQWFINLSVTDISPEKN
jgi:hypothetical protein